MPSLRKLLVVPSVLVLVSATSVFAQSPAPVIPSPEPGFNQSDFAKDVKEGEQSIRNDNDGQNNQKQVNDNEIDEGQQENENVHVDEQIDQNEAQEGQKGTGGQPGQEEVQGNGGKNEN